MTLASRTGRASLRPRATIAGALVVLALTGPCAIASGAAARASVPIAAPLRAAPPVTARLAVPPLAADSRPITARLAVPPLAADSPFVSGDEAREADRSSSDPPAATPGAGRLDRVASELRRSPLTVDPELGYVLDAAQRRSLVRTLRGARVPVFVAVLPSVDEDESGGDQERVIQTLQRRVGRPGVYVAVDQQGGMDLASVGVPLDLSIPYGLLFPPRDQRPVEQQEQDPAPPGWTTAPERLRTIVATIAKAGPGEPNGVIDDVEPLTPLTGSYRAARNREDAIAAGVLGTLLGLVAAGTFLGIRRAVRSARPATATGGRGRRRKGRRA